MSEDIWKIILTTTVTQALLLGLLGWLCRNLIKHLLDKDINAYKAKLDAQNLRFQISYGGIFEKQANSIIEIYQSIEKLEIEANSTLNSVGNPKETFNYFLRQLQDVRYLYNHSRILLPASLDQAIDEFLDKILKGVLGFKDADRRILSPCSDDEFEHFLRKQTEAAKEIEQEIPKLKVKLIQQVRTVISTN